MLLNPPWHVTRLLSEKQIYKNCLTLVSFLFIPLNVDVPKICYTLSFLNKSSFVFVFLPLVNFYIHLYSFGHFRRHVAGWKLDPWTLVVSYHSIPKHKQNLHFVLITWLHWYLIASMILKIQRDKGGEKLFQHKLHCLTHFCVVYKFWLKSPP